MDLQLKGKRALVTGGSRGIGKAIAQALAEEGADVIIAARSRDPLETAARELSSATGRTVRAITADTGDDASIRDLIGATVAALGGIDILVNNAATPGGAGSAGKIAEIGASHLLEDVNVKVMGYLRTAQAAAPHFIAQGWGRIINIGGLAARRTGNYVASVRNAAISSITKNLADELGPSGIAVTAIHPGATRTEKTTDEAAARVAASVTIGRIVEASEIAWLVTVLASPRSALLNGQTLQAGGGAFGPIDY